MYHCYKFGENMSNTVRDIELTMFRDARTHGRTGKQYASSHVALGVGIKTSAITQTENIH